MDKALIHFVIGSSPIMMIFPYMLLYHSYHDLTPDEQDSVSIHLETILMTLPLLYGVTFAICFQVFTFIPERTQNGLHPRFILSGGLAAGLVSLIYHYCFRIHTQWLKCDFPHLFHIGVVLFYIMVYYSLGEWIRSQILYGPQPKRGVGVGVGVASPSP